MENKIDIIEKAENAIKANLVDGKNGKQPEITTSQMRKFLSAVNVLKNKVDLYVNTTGNTEELSEELAGEIKFLKVTLAYMSGREKKVKKFAKQADIDSFIDSVGMNTKNFNTLCKYIEALVAYHKFYGGKDK